MILVTGATGQLGSAIINFLLKKLPASQLAGLTRDENKGAGLNEKGIDIRVGDYDDTDSLDRAMQGIDRVLLIAGTDEHKRVQQHQNVVEAAKKAGVSCIAYTSRALKDRNSLVNRLMDGHFLTEDYIKASGLAYVLFRNILYMDVIPIYAGKQALDTGIYLPAGRGRASYALRSDMAEAIANWLATGDCENRTYTLTNSESYSFDDVAAALTTLSGKQVTYTAVGDSEYVTLMNQRGAPARMVQIITSFLTDIKNGQEEEVSPDLSTLLGRKPASLQEGLKGLFNL